MKVKEHHINAVLDLIDQDDFKMEEALKKIDELVPTVLSYSLSDNFKLLTPEEKDYFEYLGIAIFIAAANNVDPLEDLSEEEIASIEETMWTNMELNKSKKFNQKLDAFFESSKEEDLLAFIEDGLTPEDNDFVSHAGRELMFVGLATIVEALCA